MNKQLNKKLIFLAERKALSNFKTKNKFLTGHQFALDFFSSKTPYNLKNLFPNYQSYVLEIGSGWGEFALTNAKSNPETLWLALEKKRKRVIRCLKKQEQENLENIRWMVLDSTWFFDGLFCENTFEKIIINFPDPWPKKRHRKHRFFNDNFLKTLEAITTKNAVLEFATDYWNYMEESIRLLEKSSVWKNKNGKGVILSKIENRATTYFEMLKKEEKENLYFIQFAKS